MEEQSVVQQEPEQVVVIAGGTIIAGVGVVLITLVLFAIIAFSFGDGWFLQLDSLVLDGGYVLRQQQAWLEPLMSAFTNSGYTLGFTIQTIVVTVMLIWLRPPHWRSSVVLMIVAMISGNLINIVLKDTFARPRPSVYPNEYALSSFSFPSGHAMAGTILYGSIAAIWARSLPKRRHHWLLAAICATLALIMGLSRIYFSVHYATDVVGGFVAGLAWLTALALGEHTLNRLRRTRAQPA